MSVYDDTRPRVEHLTTLINTPLLPDSGYARLELAREAVRDADGMEFWHSLSSGEQALLRIAVNILSTADQSVFIDERLRHAVGEVLYEVGARLMSQGTPADDEFNAMSDAGFEAGF